jgi:hypothetical protein
MLGDEATLFKLSKFASSLAILDASSLLAMTSFTFNPLFASVASSTLQSTPH